MIQATLKFGQQDHLVGIRTTADPAARPGVAVIFVTPGMIHSAGPFRMYREIAEAMAKSGIPSLRFDLSGIGESLAVGSGGDSLERAGGEIAAAMDAMQAAIGAQRFILFGLCSGADDAVHAARTDSRVDGLILLDGCGYPTVPFYWHRCVSHYLPRIFSVAKWSSVLRRRFLPGQATSPPSLQLGTDIREFPGREKATQDFQSLVDRGVQMRFLYTGGVSDYYNYADQLFDMLPGVQWNGLATTRYFPDTDHVAFLREDRDELIAEVVQSARSMMSQMPVPEFSGPADGDQVIASVVAESPYDPAPRPTSPV